MNHLAAIPLFAAILIAALLVIGASVTLVGSLGLFRLRTFYERLHAPTLGTSWGTAGIALASMLTFSILERSAALHELVIGVFVMITTPVGLLLLGRAAHRRDGDTVADLRRPGQPPAETGQDVPGKDAAD